MTDRTTYIRIKGDITDLRGKLAKAKTDVHSFASEASKSVAKSRQEWAGLSTSVGLVGVGMVGLSAMAARSFAGFDKSMSKVKASGADAANNIDALRAAAVKAGADTMYSASDAADAITDLAKAGVSAKDILGGALSGSLALAASGEMDVKEAAEDMSTALSQFGLDGSQAGHVADLLAAGAGKARGEVSDLGQALAQGGLVAHQTGLSLEETVGTLSLFASAGMLGSDAGTSLKTMLQRLTPQSAEAQAEFDKLGISAYDASGQFVGMTNFAGQLHDRMKKLTPEARNAALSVMFGADAVRGASVLYEQGAGGMQKWIDAINDQGFAARQAAALTDNLSGDLERLSGSLDTVAIQSGSGLNGFLRGATQSAEVLVNTLGQLPEPLLEAGALLAGAGGLGLGGAAGVMKLIGAVSDARTQIVALGKSATVAKAAIGGVGGALAVGTLALAAWADAQAIAQANADDFASTLVVVDGKIVTTAATMAEITDKLVDTKSLFGWGPSLMDLMGEIGISAQDAQGYLAGNADAIKRINQAMQDYTRSHVLNDSANTMLKDGLDALRGSLSAAEKETLQKASADQQAAGTASTYAEALARSTSGTKEGSTALKDYETQLFASANAMLKASGTQIGWEAAIDDTAKAVRKTGAAHRLANGELDLNTAKGRENQQALNQLAQSSVAYAQTLMDQGASEGRIRQEMTRSRAAFIEQAVAAGMTKTAAKKLADAYGLIPSDVATNIKVTGGEKSETKLAIVQAAIRDLPAEQQVDVLTAFDNGGIKAANTALEKINGKHVTAYVDVEAKYVDTYNRKRQGGPKLAGGGAVWGAGTATSDSIPAMLSNGEHVLKASTVRAMGGQGAVYRMTGLADAGLLSFAYGGAVQHFASGGAAKKKQTAAERAALLADLQTWVRRGTIPSDVASGSGLSQVDTMLDWADNAALSKGDRAKLKSAALGYEKTLGSLTTQLDKANTDLTTVKALYDDVYSNLSKAGSSLSDLAQATTTQHSDAAGNVWYTTDASSAASMTSKKSAEVAKMGTFMAKVGQLQKLGAGPAFLSALSEVAGSDLDQAISYADSYLSDTSQIALMNSAYDQMTAYASGTAQFVTDSAYKGGLAAAQGVVDTLTTSLSTLGEQMAASFATALGKVVVGSTVTTKKKAIGGPVNAGELYQVNEQGIEMFRPAVNGIILTASQTAQQTGSTGPATAYLTDAQMAQLAQAVVSAASRITTMAAAEQVARSRYALPGGGI